MIEKTIEKRFLSKFSVGDKKDCWVWRATKDAKGYGNFHFNLKSIVAHRFSYEFFVGKIPPGLVIDHLCRNTSCVNPSHLEPVTIYENCRRGIEALGGREKVFKNQILIKVGSMCSQQEHLISSEKDIKGWGTIWRKCRACFNKQRRLRPLTEHRKEAMKKYKSSHKKEHALYRKTYRAKKRG